MSSLAGNEVVVSDQVRVESGHAAAFRIVDWLGLAAAPTFAIMALLTGVLDGRQPDTLCKAMQHPSPLVGMVPMYLLMSAFHFGPWLKTFPMGKAARGRSHAWGRCVAAIRGSNGLATAFDRRRVKSRQWYKE